jgi:hypothetical protein
VRVSAGQLISAAGIAAGNLVFTPQADASGAGYDAFTFQVQDDGGTARGGIDLDPTPRTMHVAVAAVNDAPTGADKAVTLLQDTDYVFSANDFGFTDAGDAAGNALLAVKITTLPGAGALRNDGVYVRAGELVSRAAIDGGKLVFSPAAHASGVRYASFTFQVGDDGGSANGGYDLDATPRSMTLNVAARPDAAPIFVPAVAVVPPASASNETPATPAPNPPARADAVHAHAVDAPAAAASQPAESAPGFEVAAALSGQTILAASAGAAGSAGSSAAASSTWTAGTATIDVIRQIASASDQPAFVFGAAPDSPADVRTAEAVRSTLEKTAFAKELDKVRQDVQEQARHEEQVVSSAIVGSTGLSVGYLIWLLRSGTLLSSLLSSLPAWRTLDPFPVLSRLGEEEDDEDDDSLEALVAKDRGAAAVPKPRENT